jgi:hypothetical protein
MDISDCRPTKGYPIVYTASSAVLGPLKGLVHLDPLPAHWRLKANRHRNL